MRGRMKPSARAEGSGQRVPVAHLKNKGLGKTILREAISKKADYAGEQSVNGGKSTVKEVPIFFKKTDQAVCSCARRIDDETGSNGSEN